MNSATRAPAAAAAAAATTTNVEGTSAPDNSSVGQDGFQDLFRQISTLPGHDVFFQKLINAKCIADMKKSVVQLHWRGYTTKVSPNQPPFSKDVFLDRLLLALAGIDSLTSEENAVII